LNRGWLEKLKGCFIQIVLPIDLFMIQLRKVIFI